MKSLSKTDTNTENATTRKINIYLKNTEIKRWKTFEI